MMEERSLPPQVDGPPQGRLDLIFGKPVVFPPPRPSQSFIFIFRWWGDTRPCTLRMPPDKSETRTTHLVTCSAVSFRQYLSDMRNLHVTLKIGGNGHTDTHDNDDSFEQYSQSPRRAEGGDTPRQRLLHRQQRLKKGWQDGDIVGSFVLPDLKLNARGDYVSEGRILNGSGDLIGSVLVTMVFLSGSFEEFQELQTKNDVEVVSPPSTNSSPEKSEARGGRSRLSGIPVPESRLKTQKNPTQEGSRHTRSWSFRESIKQKCDKLKSPKKHQLQQQQQQQQQHSFDFLRAEKENQAPQRKRANSFTKSSGREGLSGHQDHQTMRKSNTQESHLHLPGYTEPPQEPVTHSNKDRDIPPHNDLSLIKTQNRDTQVDRNPQLPHRAVPQKVPEKSPEVAGSPIPVVRRERKGKEGGSSERARPISWGLYPLPNEADPHSLVESGAVKAEELPFLLKVHEGHSPGLDLTNVDPNTRKLLEGLDLSFASGGLNGLSPGRFRYNNEANGPDGKSAALSVFNKEEQRDQSNSSDVTISGVWPLEEQKPGPAEDTIHLPPTAVPQKVLLSERAKSNSPRKSLMGQSSKILMSQGSRTSEKAQAQRSLSTCAGPEKRLFATPYTSSQPGEEEGTWMEVKTTQEKFTSEEGSLLVVDVGTLGLSSPLLPPTHHDIKKKVTGARVLHRSRVCYLTTLDLSLPGALEWDLSQTCASRQLVDQEVSYDMRVALKLPSIPVAEVLKGFLIISCLCRRLGERESEEVGSSSISLLDLWQLNGSEMLVPLYASPHLTRRLSRRGRKMEEQDKLQSFAHITFTANLTLSPGHGQQQHQGEGRAQGQVEGRGATPKPESSQRSVPQVYAWNGAVRQETHRPSEDNMYPKKFTDINNLFTSMDSSSGSDFSEPKLSLAEARQLSQYSNPKIFSSSLPKCQKSPEFNSIYLPAHMSPSDKVRRGTVQYAGGPGAVGHGENIIGPQYSHTQGHSHNSDPGYQGHHSSFLAAISEYNGSSNQPVESGGESPCITTATDCCADYIDYNTLGWRAGVDPRRDDKGCCSVHLEILKGRNLPWIEGGDGIPQPPNCYVRASVGAVIVFTNICWENVNPLWNFAADVMLPYSQLAQTNGSLILKVYHSQTQQRVSMDDLLLGFVSVDVTSLWSGHVSLCGWYPMLDLQGTMRGHVKVSLTPHEPPLNVAVNTVRQPVLPHNNISSYGHPMNQQLPRQSSHPHCSASMPDPRTNETCYFQGDSACSSVPNAVVRLSSSVPQFTTKSQQEMYNQSLQGIKDTPSTGEVTGTQKSQVSEVSETYKSATGKENGDLPHDRMEECSGHSKPHTGDRTQSTGRKTSGIPVFSSNKTPVKSSKVDDKGKFNSYLPKVDYRDKENLHPTSEVMSQGYCQHKGSIVVRCVSKESGQEPNHPDTEPKPSCSMNSSLHQNGEKAGRKESTQIMDSLIMSHYRMQKEKEREEVNSQLSHDSQPGPSPRGVMSNSSSDSSQSNSQHSMSDSRSSQSGGKPSSCLKAPGSPSLRVKHVTFAHKLVQHQNGDTKLQSHFSQGDVSWRPHQSSQPLPPTTQDTASPRNLRHGYSLGMERSDLQVVPCREGDPQAHSGVVGSQGCVKMNGHATSTAHDRAKEDLMMQFSWMNQSGVCDTPCASFIEPKVPAQHNAESNHMCSSQSPPDDKMGASCPGSSTTPKRTRKFRSRIAANFTLK